MLKLKDHVALVTGAGVRSFCWSGAVAFVGLFSFYSGHFQAPGPLWGSVIGGLLIAAAWGLTRNAWIARSQVASIKKLTAWGDTIWQSALRCNWTGGYE